MTFKKFIFSILLVIYYSSNAQTRREVVEVDLNGKAFKSNLPFDINFNINGSFGKEKIDVIILKCTPIKGGDSNYFKYQMPETFMGQIDFNKNEFSFTNVRPLRPNNRYNFQFYLGKQIELSTDFKKHIFEYLKYQFTNIFEYDEAKNKETLEDINLDFRTYLKDNYGSENIKIIDKNGNIGNFTLQLDPFSGKLLELSNKIIPINAKIKNAEDNIKNYKDFITKQTPNSLKSTFGSILKRDSNRIGEQNIKLLNFLNTDTDSNDLQIVIDAMSGNEAFLKQLEALSNSLLKIQTKDNKDFLSTSEKKDIEFLKDSFLPILAEIEKSSKELKVNTEELKKVENSISIEPIIDDFIASIQFSEVIDEPFIDRETEKSPYFAYESGVGLRFQPIFENFTSSVRFASLNISLLPVNKKVPINDFKFPYNLLKSLSLQVGMAKAMFAQQDSRIINYIGTDRSLLLGAGVRLGILRLNYSGVVYKIADKNPTITNPQLKFVPYLSASISIGIKSITDIISANLSN